jgi:hypothetical protein
MVPREVFCACVCVLCFCCCCGRCTCRAVGGRTSKSSARPDSNQWPFELQSNALPLSYSRLQNITCDAKKLTHPSYYEYIQATSQKSNTPTQKFHTTIQTPQHQTQKGHKNHTSLHHPYSNQRQHTVRLLPTVLHGIPIILSVYPAQSISSSPSLLGGERHWRPTGIFWLGCGLLSISFPTSIVYTHFRRLFLFFSISCRRHHRKKGPESREHVKC